VDKTRKEVMIYRHCCPECYPAEIGLIRLSNDVNVLVCENCGFRVDDSSFKFKKIPIEELTYSYMSLVKQVLLNTKSDYTKYSQMSNCENRFKLRRAKRELNQIMDWINLSRILCITATIANLNAERFKLTIMDSIKSKEKYNWKMLFNKF